jgi:hypothetical protein
MTAFNTRLSPTTAPPLSSPPPLVDPRVARRAVLTWSSIIVGLLLLQVGLCAVGVIAATRSKAVAVEADYYNKALHWDQEKALLRASQELGWGVTLTIGDVATTNGSRALMLKLADPQGKPIEDATVEVAYFHHARPGELRRASLAGMGEGGGGLYASSVPLDRAGKWEFRLTIHRGGQAFIETLQQDLVR